VLKLSRRPASFASASRLGVVCGFPASGLLAAVSGPLTHHLRPAVGKRCKSLTDKVAEDTEKNQAGESGRTTSDRQGAPNFRAMAVTLERFGVPRTWEDSHGTASESPGFPAGGRGFRGGPVHRLVSASRALGLGTNDPTQIEVLGLSLQEARHPFRWEPAERGG
jgi:hypothetical protein